jgi:tRNA(Ile2) C34 agmatinyltransferase TiaS
MPSKAWAASAPMVPAMVALPHLDAQLAAGLNFEAGNSTSMNPQVTRFTLCPSCGRHMRTFSKSEIYECKECRVFVTEPGWATPSR